MIFTSGVNVTTYFTSFSIC